MGRELRRVPMDFDWPINKTWWGFVSPYSAPKCHPCDGSGYSPEAKQLADDWYDFERTGRRWCDKITQDEVDALVKAGRLHDFTSHFERGRGWVKNDPPTHPTAEQVNAANVRPGLGGHDAINRCICIEQRAKRLGVVLLCKWCEGAGELWSSDRVRRSADRWKPVEPPSGPGFQIWETVSEGSPISPVFATAEELARHMEGTRWGGDHGTPYETWLKFINGPGWSVSFVSDSRGLVDGVTAAVQP